MTGSICLGILKTDQWKPNSKMNQGECGLGSWSRLVP